MATLEKMNIAFCFNKEEDAKVISEQLSGIAPAVNFIIGSTFDGFLKSIAKLEKIDCFIIEESFKECKASDLIEKLQRSQKYKKSAIALLTPNMKKIDTKFLEMNLDLVFDVGTELSDVSINLKKILTKKFTSIIPENFNVLVLENSPDILELISMHLNDLGHKKMSLCQSIKDAKTAIGNDEFDILLLDWNLDDGTCIDLVEHIKTASISKRTKEALIVVITGRDDVDDIMTLLRYGIKDHIIKPFGFNEFEDKLSYAMEKHKKRI